jgi:hypothetical protein
MPAPFLSYHAAMAGLANMAAAISPTETSLLIARLHMISVIERLTIDSGPVRVNWTKGKRLFFCVFISSALGQSRRSDRAPMTSGLPRLADIFRVRRHVSKVPQADITLAMLTFCAGHPPTPARVFSLQALTNL